MCGRNRLLVLFPRRVVLSVTAAGRGIVRETLACLVNLTKFSALSAHREDAMTYTEQTLTCRDCGQTFAFTVGEQDATNDFVPVLARVSEAEDQLLGATTGRRKGRGGTCDGHQTPCASSAATRRSPRPSWQPAVGRVRFL